MNELFALMFLSLGIYMLGRTNSIIRYGVPVKLKVVCKLNELGECDDDFTLLYKVQDGEYAGKVTRGAIGSIIGIHKIGSIVDGLYLERSGDMESNILLWVWRKVSWSIIVGALAVLFWKLVLPQLNL